MENTIIMLQTREGKTNHFAKVQQHGIMRHVNVHTCAHSALALDFYYRYHIQFDPFPDVLAMPIPHTIAPAVRAAQSIVELGEATVGGLDDELEQIRGTGDHDSESADHASSSDEEEVEEDDAWYNYRLTKGM